MAEYLNVPYPTVCKAAVIPALLYYFALFMVADSRAAKNNLQGLPPENLPPVPEALLRREYHHGLPLLFLIVVIVLGWSPLRAAFWLIVLADAIALIVKRDIKDWTKRFIEALYQGSK